MRRNESFWIVLFVVVAAMSGAAWAENPPALMNFQGVLRDPQGAPLTGDYGMVFRFFDAAEGGNELLVDEHLASGTGAVVVTGGLFNVMMGSGEVLDGSSPGVFTSLRDVFRRVEQVHVEIEIAGPAKSPEILGRILINVPPYTPVGPDPVCADYVNRFVDCGNGTVTDTLTGLIWMKDAYCPDAFYYPFGGRWPTWVEATEAVAALGDGQCGLTDGSAPGDWRLPTKNEWEALLKPSCEGPWGYWRLPDRAGTGCYNDDPWATNVRNFYHGATTYEPIPANAWDADTSTGVMSFGAKTYGGGHVWAVRDGSGQ